MHRSPFVVLIGLALVLAACGGTAGESTGAGLQGEPTEAPSSIATSSPAGIGDPMSPSMAWSFGNEATTEAGDVGLEFSGTHEFAENAVVLDGVTGFGASDVTAPMDTTSSFSVSAWVSLANPVQFANVVSQVGEEAASFFLGQGEATWGFAMKDADTNTPGHTIRASADPSLLTIGEWTHLVGVHDAEEGEIRLYVNGMLAAGVGFDQPWQADGELTIGVSQSHFAPDAFWPGAIASVAIYPGVLTSEHVRDLHVETEPVGAPPVVASAATALTGTWDYVLDEAGREVILENFTGLVDSADEIVTRIGFDGNKWWQGFLFDGELFLLHGVPEGSGGSFFLATDGPVISMTDSCCPGHLSLEYAIEGDELSLAVVETCVPAGAELTCDRDRSAMDPIMMLVMDQTFTRSGDDTSY